jgi:threonine/homoserine/homoserine lactone efflux protein
VIELGEVGRLAPYLAAVLILELTPGPNMAFLALVAAERGLRAGLVTVAGVTAGLLVWLLASIGGLVEIAAARPNLLWALKWAGVAYLVWLSVDTWRGAGDGGVTDGRAAGSLFGRGFLTNILNPKAALLYVSLIPAFVSKEPGALPAAALSLGLIHIAVSVTVHGAIVVGMATSRRRLGPAVAGQSSRLSKVFAVALAGVAVWTALGTG